MMMNVLATAGTTNKSNDTYSGRRNCSTSRIVSALFSTNRNRNYTTRSDDYDSVSTIETVPSWISESDSIYSGNNRNFFSCFLKKKDHSNSSRRISRDMMIQRRPTPPPSILKVKTLEYSLSLTYVNNSSPYSYGYDTLQQQQQRQNKRVSFDKVDIHYHDTIIDVSEHDGSIMNHCLDWKQVDSKLAINVDHNEAEKIQRLQKGKTTGIPIGSRMTRKLLGPCRILQPKVCRLLVGNLTPSSLQDTHPTTTSWSR
jgi:hypothetical protein